MFWDWFIETFRTAIFASSQMFGGNIAGGIIVVTVCVRLALLPLTLRLAKISAAHQELMAKLKPDLDRIRSRYRDQPQQLAAKTQKLFEREGAKPLPMASCLGALAQTPIFLALFSAVRKSAVAGGRFLWVRNIAQPDALLAILVALLTCASVAAMRNAPEQGRTAMLLLPLVFTLVALWQLSAGVAIYWGVSSALGLAQSLVARYQPVGRV